jgi:hypothetical protein
MSTEPPPEGGPVSPPVALAFAVVSFVALAIAGLGVGSLLLDADVIDAPGGSQWPGVVGMLLATGGFAAALWSGVRAPHPSFWTAALTALGAFLGEVVGVTLGAALAGLDPATAVAVAGGVAAGWPGLVIAGAGGVCGWGGVALVRTRARRPRWPWEGE